MLEVKTEGIHAKMLTVLISKWLDYLSFEFFIVPTCYKIY